MNVSHEICKKPIICFGIFVFSHLCPLLWEFSFLMFSKLRGFCFTQNGGAQSVQETQTFRIFVFSHNFSVLSTLTIPIFWVLGIAWISTSREICKKHLTLECSIFSYFSLGDNTIDVKTSEKFLFLIPFPHKRLWKTTYFLPEPDPVSTF